MIFSKIILNITVKRVSELSLCKLLLFASFVHGGTLHCITCGFIVLNLCIHCGIHMYATVLKESKLQRDFLAKSIVFKSSPANMFIDFRQEGKERERNLHEREKH